MVSEGQFKILVHREYDKEPPLSAGQFYKEPEEIFVEKPLPLHRMVQAIQEEVGIPEGSQDESLSYSISILSPPGEPVLGDLTLMPRADGVSVLVSAQYDDPKDVMQVIRDLHQ